MIKSHRSGNPTAQKQEVRSCSCNSQTQNSR